MKCAKPRKVQTEMIEVALRRSSRVANLPTSVYKEVVPVEKVMVPRTYSSNSKRRDLSNRVYASDEARAAATEKAEALGLGFGYDYPTFVKPVLQSRVIGGFWLFFLGGKLEDDVVVAPSFLYLDQVKSSLTHHIEISGKNYWVGKGEAFTGEVSVEQLKDIGAKWVTLGHSKRRHVLGEDD